MNFLRVRSSQRTSRPNIPPELWTLIFEYLRYSDLSQARQVCRHWNKLIVNSPLLMIKFKLKLLEKTLSPESDPIRELVASPPIRFSRVLLHGETFIDTGTWWPQIGRNLQVLEINNRKIEIEGLVELLREAPMLKVLKFCSNYIAGEEIVPQIDFKLSSLEVLEMETDCPASLRTVQQMCPRLKKLSLNVVPLWGLDPSITSRDVIDFIRTVRNSLERITVRGTEDNLLEELLNVEGLHFKRVSVSCSDREPFTELSKEQPSVEELCTNICSDKILYKIGTALPNLQTLSCGFCENPLTTVQFLSVMQKLKCLTIASQWIEKSHSTLKFSLPKHHRLERFTLKNGKQTLHWIEHFPNLRTLNLHDCRIQSWPDFYVAVSLLKDLKTVELKCVHAMEKKVLGEEILTNIEDLSVICCDVSKTFLSSLITSCPNLAKIHLENMQIVDDDKLLVVCKISKQLKSLSLSGLSYVTCKSVSIIAEYSPELDKVSFVECCNVADNAVKLLKKTKIYKVAWKEWQYD